LLLAPELLLRVSLPPPPPMPFPLLPPEEERAIAVDAEFETTGGGLGST
jgi:hypothetical protein